MSFRCTVCGQEHDGLPAIALAAPSAWFAAPEDRREDEFELTEDLCIEGDQHFFICGELLIPIVDADAPPLTFSVWSTLSQTNFDRYLDA